MVYREYCYDCYRPRSVCLCEMIRPFHSRTRFVILMHAREARREKNGTGRLCNRALLNSRLLIGVDFSEDQRVQDLLNDQDYTSVLLFPTTDAVNISREGYRALVSGNQRLQIFVVDGTWTLAGKILKLSKNLQALPTVSFTPRRPSNFRIKKQPRAECLSTLESIHLLLELGREQGIENGDADFEQLPKVFKRLVDIQLECAARNGNGPGSAQRGARH